MSELSNAQRLVQDLRSLRKIQKRIEELSSNWGDVHPANQEDLEVLAIDIGVFIEDWEERLEDEKQAARENR